MSLRILDPDPQLAERLRDAIEAALPGARVRVTPTAPGHFELEVEAEAFRGRSRLEQHQSVYGAIAPLMRGDAAPVHAIDRLRTRVP